MPKNTITLIAACAASVAVVFLGIYLMSPKKSLAGLLLVWGSFAVSCGIRANARRSRHALLLAGIVTAVIGGATLLLASDWSASGVCPAVIYCTLRQTDSSLPANGAEVILKSGKQEVLRGTTDENGIWLGCTNVPYEWHYRMVGSGGEIELHGLSLLIHYNEARSEVDLHKIDNVQVFGRTQSQIAPAFIVVSLEITPGSSGP